MAQTPLFHIFCFLFLEILSRYFSLFFFNFIIIIIISIIVILHSAICVDYDSLGSSYGLSTRGQHLIYIRRCHMAAQSATRIGTTEPYPFTGNGSFTVYYDAWGWLSQDTGPPIILESEPVMYSDQELNPGRLRGSPEHWPVSQQHIIINIYQNTT